MQSLLSHSVKCMLTPDLIVIDKMTHRALGAGLSAGGWQMRSHSLLARSSLNMSQL